MKIYLSCYHKTGTHFFQNLKNILRKHDKENVYIADIWSHDANKIPPNEKGVKIIHLIRHPYEIIMSGLLYHKKCTETWCVNPRTSTKADNINYNFQGLSYQNKLNTLNTEDGINFEMEGRSYNTIIDMYNAHFYDYPFCLNIKMEDLILHFDETIAKIIHFINLKNIDCSSLKNSETYMTNTTKMIDRYAHFFTDKNYHHFNDVFSNINLKKYNYRLKASVAV
jgi:hypothetical protein